MDISRYLEEINRHFQNERSREHSYRADLQQLLDGGLDDVMVTNEPARIECGAPDYILTKNEIPVGYIEAKDIGEPLDGEKHRKQFTRYKESLPNLIITDYLRFILYRDGERVREIKLAEVQNEEIVGVPENFGKFRNLILNFVSHTSQTITSSSELSKIMAKKARLLSTIIEEALETDSTSNHSQKDSALRKQLAAFRDVLIHDLDAEEFADIYAQTIAYGMFAARLHDPTLDTFTRHEAARLIPKSNPFLRKLFQHIAGYDLDERIDWIVDELADAFRATDVASLLEDFSGELSQNDPIIHFYETFLAKFDPELRRSRGVWYTPEPVVEFMVNSVDDILKSEFELFDGLADTTKTTISVETDVRDERYSSGYREKEKEVHKVQILDPATGTGTFLAEAVRRISKKFEGQEGVWPTYVEEHLIPRLNGFEILMASYAMAHLKLDLLLRESGYEKEIEERFRVFLTNSLEEHHPDTGTLFANWLSTEAKEANKVKQDTPVMIVMGNPPYSGESSNTGEWIMGLMEDYKKEPGGKRKLQEKNSKWINDDYVKFIRYGEHLISKNSEGVLAFINPHGYLDNPTFRGMRWKLLDEFDKIYTIDLHGNAKKGALAPDGVNDENVFDIQQGVSINFFIKREDSDELADVYYTELYGSREKKYSKLGGAALGDLSFEKVKTLPPRYYFVPRDYELKSTYDEGFSLKDLFVVEGNGIVTKRDSLCIQRTAEDAFEAAEDILKLEKDNFYEKYDLPSDVRDWKYEWAREDVKKSGPRQTLVEEINYRPFDRRYIYYTGNSRGFVGWPVEKIMENYIDKDNLGLLCPKALEDNKFAHIFVTDVISEAIFLSSKTGSNARNFPLYLYDRDAQVDFKKQGDRTPNLNKEEVERIQAKLGLTFVKEKQENKKLFAPIDLLDYIYAYLHSPNYRERFREFLKTNYPKVPYPADVEKFWSLVDLGRELRMLHLMKHPVLANFDTTFPNSGSNKVLNRLTKTDPGFVAEDSGDTVTSQDSDPEVGKIWINEEQFFGNVRRSQWEFQIGGYQPAQKWLKARRDEVLDFEQIQYYQRILKVLKETDRIMGEIDRARLKSGKSD